MTSSDLIRPSAGHGEPNELDAKITDCRAATKAYRDAWKKADDLMRELKARGLCPKCCIGEHSHCTDYGCICCGGGK